MFSSLLIANRGEIARRIIATARRMGLTTIAVATEADRSWPHWREADEAVFIGEGPAADSYLSIPAILEAARRAGAEAVHPGYGFLAESAEFAEACAAAGLVFVGPPADAIRAMGSKARARALMIEAGLPVAPGYHGEEQDAGLLAKKAEEIGYPVLIKADQGGGGRGMRRVDRPQGFREALASAQREAGQAFGDERVILERLIAAPRHIEVQIFADGRGNVVHLFERDCSVQRRHQKIVEEAPAPGLAEPVRRAITEAAMSAARAVGYRNAGTVELLADAERGLSADAFYFMEMNTRLQVEHPVTEAVTGLDLVEWQLRVAAGEPLPLSQDDIRLAGHAVEARLYAEDPAAGFAPSAGRVRAAAFPQGEGLRVDAGVAEGAVVSPYYDSLLAKIVAWGRDRDEALKRLADALARTRLAGPRTNLALLSTIVQRLAITSSSTTDFVDRHLAELVPPRPDPGLAAAAVEAWIERESERLAQAAPGPWRRTDAFEIAGLFRRSSLPLAIDGAPAEAEIAWSGGRAKVRIKGHEAADETSAPDIVWADREILILHECQQLRVAFPDPLDRDPAEAEGGAAVAVPMHGRIAAVSVAPGDLVAKGDPLFTLEAMKMEHTIAAPVAGRVEAVHVRAGEQAREGAPAVALRPAK